MNKLVSTIKSYFSSPLPVGMSEFEQWSEDIISLVGPIADSNSIKFALASQIMHLDPKKSSVSKQYFVRCLRKSAANQVASQVFQNIKIAQTEAAEKAAKEAQIAADTAKQEAVSNVPEVQ